MNNKLYAIMLKKNYLKYVKENMEKTQDKVLVKKKEGK